MKKLIVVKTMLLLFITGTQAADYYIDNSSGKDSNKGLAKNNALATFSKAVKMLKPGDRLHIADTGKPYRQRFRLNKISGTPQKPIIINGNGALLSGFAVVPVDKWTNKENGLLEYSYPKPLPTHCRPFVQIDGKILPRSEKAENLPEGAYAWLDNRKILLRPSKKQMQGNIEITAGESGIQMFLASYIHINNLKVCGNYNDGINIHGSCQGLEFSGIESFNNGDDGFSAHEDATVKVRDSRFYNNLYGIQDIGASQTSFYGVVSENNQYGACFNGGYHSLIDCTVRNNTADQVRIAKGAPPGKEYGTNRKGPFYQGMLYIRNTDIKGGARGIVAVNGASAMIISSRISGCEYGLLLDSGALCELRNSTISDNGKFNIRAKASMLIEGGNKFKPGKFLWNDKNYNPDKLQDFLKAAGSEKSNSTVIK